MTDQNSDQRHHVFGIIKNHAEMTKHRTEMIKHQLEMCKHKLEITQIYAKITSQFVNQMTSTSTPIAIKTEPNPEPEIQANEVLPNDQIETSVEETNVENPLNVSIDEAETSQPRVSVLPRNISFRPEIRLRSRSPIRRQPASLVNRRRRGPNRPRGIHRGNY